MPSGRQGAGAEQGQVLTPLLPALGGPRSSTITPSQGFTPPTGERHVCGAPEHWDAGSTQADGLHHPGQVPGPSLVSMPPVVDPEAWQGPIPFLRENLRSVERLFHWASNESQSQMRFLLSSGKLAKGSHFSEPLFLLCEQGRGDVTARGRSKC